MVSPTSRTGFAPLFVKVQMIFPFSSSKLNPIKMKKKFIKAAKQLGRNLSSNSLQIPRFCHLVALNLLFNLDLSKLKNLAPLRMISLLIIIQSMMPEIFGKFIQVFSDLFKILNSRIISLVTGKKTHQRLMQCL